MRSAIVLGSAPGALEELARAGENWRPLTDAPIVAVNRAGILWTGPLEAWVTLHANELDGWAQARTELGADPPAHYVTHGRGCFAVEVELIRSHWPGSSGLFAVQWALEHGHYDRVVLCGVHMTGQQRLEEDGVVREAPMKYDHYRNGWSRAEAKLRGRVASMGGWTQELLGAPDEDFWTVL